MDNNKRTVVVTGFGPFGEHMVNASWVAVQAVILTLDRDLGSEVRELSVCVQPACLPFRKHDSNIAYTCPQCCTEAVVLWVHQELQKLGLGKKVDLHVYEVPVEYQAVQSLVPSLWEQYHPQLVVHVGVSGMATTVTLEKCGHNYGYKGLDNSRLCPDSQCCVVGGPACIDSVIDMESVCKRVSASGLGVTVSVSKDAGRYLCDFTYYTSLYLSRGRSAFVHVPPLGKPYSGPDLGRALQAIVREMLQHQDHHRQEEQEEEEEEEEEEICCHHLHSMTSS
ncbi:hypothetical protein CRUP_034993 [Coryphaenoides rupestris]|nr:hypothetical protein CRUP_034993 [Coryphaenoides rupestris]